jgi:hexosaminidase
MLGGERMMRSKQWSIDLPKSGYNTILSNGFYIDLMLGLESHYLNDPLPKRLFL